MSVKLTDLKLLLWNMFDASLHCLIFLTVCQKLMFMHVSAVSAGTAAWPPDKIQRLSLRSPRMPHPHKTTQPTAPTVKQ